MFWTETLSQLEVSRAEMRRLPKLEFSAGSVLFQAEDHATGFVVVLEGRIEVRLTGVSGREILLYAVEPGQSCVQTTLGLLGDESYTGEAVCATDCTAVLIPKTMFLNLMNQDASFRAGVLRAFGRRMADLTHVLEQVAFVPVEQRLAQALIEMAQAGMVSATQAELAARIGSAREVITRRLEAFTRNGWVETERGRIRILNEAALVALISKVM